jgi:TPR repeat protein
MSLHAFTASLAATGFILSACSHKGAMKIDAASQGAAAPTFAPDPSRPEEQFDLAMRYDSGDGVAGDDAWAEYWAWRAALQGHEPARDWLRKRAHAEPFDQGIVVFEALERHKKWAHPSAQLWLALAGPDPKASSETRRDLVEHALPVIRDQALRGNAWSKYLVGAVHDLALADATEARRWYSEAAELGNVLAQDSLGHLYEEGRGVPADSREAARWFQAAANQGYAPSESMIGWLYDTGRGVAQNPAEALRWFTAAAAQGDAAGQANLGTLYDRGRGTAEDPKEAARWYLKAAEQGLAFAQYRLGSLYVTGRGVGRDEDQALRWFRAAAQGGSAEAVDSIHLVEARARARRAAPAK